MDTAEVERMIAGLNSHIPVAKRSLLEIAETGDRTYRVRSGETIEIETSEIEYLLNICTEIEKMQLRLPIFVVTDVSGDMPAWRIDGRTEARIIARMLGKPLIREDSVRIYHPDYQKLAKTLPNSISVLYLP